VGAQRWLCRRLPEWKRLEIQGELAVLGGGNYRARGTVVLCRQGAPRPEAGGFEGPCGHWGPEDPLCCRFIARRTSGNGEAHACDFFVSCKDSFRFCWAIRAPICLVFFVALSRLIHSRAFTPALGQLEGRPPPVYDLLLFLHDINTSSNNQKMVVILVVMLILREIL
jgi:hypothetical protein